MVAEWKNSKGEAIRSAVFGQRGRMVGGLVDRCCNICCLLCWVSDKLLMNTFLVQSALAGRAFITVITNILIIKFVQHLCCNCPRVKLTVLLLFCPFRQRSLAAGASRRIVQR